MCLCFGVCVRLCPCVRLARFMCPILCELVIFFHFFFFVIFVLCFSIVFDNTLFFVIFVFRDFVSCFSRLVFDVRDFASCFFMICFYCSCFFVFLICFCLHFNKKQHSKKEKTRTNHDYSFFLNVVSCVIFCRECLGNVFGPAVQPNTSTSQKMTTNL